MIFTVSTSFGIRSFLSKIRPSRHVRYLGMIDDEHEERRNYFVDEEGLEPSITCTQSKRHGR